MFKLDLLKYLINHVILPKKLPHKTIESDIDNESSFLYLIYESLCDVLKGEDTVGFDEILRIFEKWRTLQFNQKVFKNFEIRN